MRGFLGCCTDGLRFAAVIGMKLNVERGREETVFPRDHAYSALITLEARAKVLVCNFLDEWARFQSFARKRPDVRRTIRVCAPLTAEIERWPGLRAMRNQVHAHFLRDKQDRLVDPVTLSIASKAPTAFAATTFLVPCALGVCEVVARHHEAAGLRTEAVVAATRPPVFDEDGNQIADDYGMRTFGELHAETTKIWGEVLSLDPDLADLADLHRSWPGRPAFP
jgi:hypothetical protein